MSEDHGPEVGLSAVPSAVAISVQLPSEEGFLPDCWQVYKWQLEQSGGKSGVLTSFKNRFNICFANVLICTNSFSLQKGLLLKYAPAGASKSIPHCQPQELL